MAVKLESVEAEPQYDMTRRDTPLLNPLLAPDEREAEALRLYFELFRQEQYFECHDVMEEIWMETPGPERKFFQGLLQCAVALHHWGNQNLNGARILYREGTKKLQPFRPEYQGVDLEEYLVKLEGLLPVEVRRD
jgi:predicted metal-dependent hydrolase